MSRPLTSRGELVDPLLAELGAEHGFGTRASQPPEKVARVKQVHGASCVVLPGDASLPDPPPEADALVSTVPGAAAGIVTADCVPILVAAEGAVGVAAIHAGWRGLAAGVISSAVAALRAELPAGQAGSLYAAVGPHIGPCCYEVDGPVTDALEARCGFDAVRQATSPSRPGHHRIDLAALAAQELLSAGLTRGGVSLACGECTMCDAERFHSYRRDAADAGRLLHHIAARAPRP